MKEKIMLRSTAKTIEPIVRIGKSGLKASMLEEIEKNLKKRKLIKIRLLRASFKGREKEELINSIVQMTNSQLIESVGNIIVLYRK